ncbi:hypothetical protein EVAR_42505_1 [Eumeta japonica]|uniref:Uncharacterized protein n=1 Tax=Eumeta variegata TaxID=151549 RepID=A0A4C1XFJ2_EUMVA|nr:hypothetical protein EVAR_42505_1 [Eumeta japonica]
MGCCRRVIALWMPQGAHRHRKSRRDSARAESLSGVPGERGDSTGWVPMKDVIPDVPGCVGGSSAEIVLQNLELVECVWVGVGEDWRRVRHHRLYAYLLERVFIPKAHFSLFTDHAAKA